MSLKFEIFFHQNVRIINIKTRTNILCHGVTLAYILNPDDDDDNDKSQ